MQTFVAKYKSDWLYEDLSVNSFALSIHTNWMPMLYHCSGIGIDAVAILLLQAHYSRMSNANKIQHSKLFIWILKSKYLATYVQAHIVDILISLFSTGIHSKQFIWFVWYCHLETRECVRKFPFVNKHYLIWNQINVHSCCEAYSIHTDSHPNTRTHIEREKEKQWSIDKWVSSINGGGLYLCCQWAHFMANFQKRELIIIPMMLINNNFPE